LGSRVAKKTLTTKAAKEKKTGGNFPPGNNTFSLTLPLIIKG
jgi:hypothetical protein